MAQTFQPPPTSQLVLVHAGFWWRVLAWAIDVIVLSVVMMIVRMVFGHAGMGHDDTPLPQNGPISNVDYQFMIDGVPHWHPHFALSNTLGLLLTAAYFVLLESSRWQATVGKRVCRLRVTDTAGQRIGLGRAIGRYVGKFVSAAIFMIGFMMAGWTLRKQALHDIMASTLVTRLRIADPVFTFQQPSAL